jgi:hypothetical protein
MSASSASLPSSSCGKGEDEEAAVGGGEAFPMVLVQIPPCTMRGR